MGLPMVEGKWRWREFLIVLLVVVAMLTSSVSAQNETLPTPGDNALTWTLPPTPDETPEEVPTDDLEVTPDEIPEETPTDDLEVTPDDTIEDTPIEALEDDLEVPTEEIFEEDLEATPDEFLEETPIAQSSEILNETAEEVVPGGTILVTDEPQVYDFSALRDVSASDDAGEGVPIVELHAYEDDDPVDGDPINMVNLGGPDIAAELDASDFNGIYGTYYPYDGDTVINKPLIVEGASDAVDTSFSDLDDENSTTTSGSIGVSDEMDNETAWETEPLDDIVEVDEDEAMDEMPTDAPVETSEMSMPTFTPMSAIEEVDADQDQTQATPLSLSSAILALLAAAGLIMVIQRR